MADDASARPSLRHGKSGGGSKVDGSNPTAATATSTGIGAPPGHALRRAKTAAETSTARRLSSDSSAFESPHPPPPRRSSNFSDYGVNEARSILNPHGKAARGSSGSSNAAEQGSELSSLAGLSLAFALLPAIAGALFKNGSAVTTDIMLLGLAGVFLHWSVTQPW